MGVWESEILGCKMRVVYCNGYGDTSMRIRLWKEVIVSKYGEASPWCTEMVTDTYGVGVWRTIRNLWQLMEHNICLKVGNGAKTKFWRDRWLDQTPL